MNKFLLPRTYVNYARFHLSRPYKRSYSQQGEDLLIRAALRDMGIAQPTYLDVGAHDPVRGNNTYLMYRSGARGVLIEPNPKIISALRLKRPGDTVIQAGIAPEDNPNAEYFIMSFDKSQLNTFRREEAEAMVRTGSYGEQKIRSVLRVPLISINTLMAKHFEAGGPDVLSLDAEGYDLEIIRALDFSHYAPRCICVETLRYDAEGNLYKVRDIVDFLLARGYEIFADTHVNTILVQNR
jgi:FkbM family methyltransferase